MPIAQPNAIETPTRLLTLFISEIRSETFVTRKSDVHEYEMH